MDGEYLTVKDASKITTLAASTLYTYIHYKKIPILKIGSRIVFEKSELKKWMEARKQKGGESAK
jgi:excisionase family DNA binding protein